MSYDPNNLLAKILRGESDASRVLETEHCLSVFEISPKAALHVLVIAKRAVASFTEFCSQASPEEVAGFFQGVNATVTELGLDEADYRLVVDQPHAGSTHFHVNILAGGLAPFEWQGEEPELQPELVFFLHAAVESPQDEQVTGYAQATGLDLTSARTHLECPLPRVIRRGPAGELRELAGRLADLELAFDAFHVNDLSLSMIPWRVEWLEVEDSGLWMVGEEGRVPLRVDKPAFLVRGREGTALGLGGGGNQGPLTTALRMRPSGRFRVLKPEPKRGEFAHLYLSGKLRPFCFAESSMRDYVFLGEDMSVSARANYERLLDIISDNELVQVNADMLKAPLLVPDVARAFWSDPSEATGAAELLSALIYHMHVAARVAAES